MISLEKWMILTLFQKLPNNVGYLGKIIIATSIEWLPKVQKNRPIWSHCNLQPNGHRLGIKQFYWRGSAVNVQIKIKHCEPCYQMLELKGSPNAYKSCPNSRNSSSYIKWSFSKGPKSHQSFWATLVSKFVTKNFQKSPNLVTQIVSFPASEVAKIISTVYKC